MRLLHDDCGKRGNCGANCLMEPRKSAAGRLPPERSAGQKLRLD